MVKRLVILLVSILMAGTIAVGAILVWNTAVMVGNSSAPDGSRAEKPILLMTPSDLFSNPRLRKLAVAAQQGDVKKIDALIAQGVDVNGPGKYGITPLFSAWQVRNTKGFEALLAHGADPNNVWTTGETLLNLIAGAADPDLLELALKYGANPNLVELRTDETPIFPASQFLDGNGNVPILIKAGANLNYQSKPLMKTAMMDAAGDGHFHVVYNLLVAGADYRLRDANNHDIRHWIEFAYGISMSNEQRRWRDRAIDFLKQHKFWNGDDSNRFEPDLIGELQSCVDCVDYSARLYDPSLGRLLSVSYPFVHCVLLGANGRNGARH